MFTENGFTGHTYSIAECEYFVDGSASTNSDTGKNQVGYAVVTSHATVKSNSLPATLSAQVAEIIVLTEACKLAEGKTVNIFTDS